MAFAFHNYALAIMLLAMIPFQGTYGSRHHHDHHKHLKSLHFSLFQHETLNKTGYIIVNGVQGGPRINSTIAPFGTLFVFQDPLTATANRSSKVVGTSEGTTITSSFDGLQSMSLGKITLRLKHHKGSISTVGSVNNIKPSDVPVVGGTEDFLFVQGYVTASPVDLKRLTVVYKVEFHLYWPPYATQATGT